jgi:S1-C subfamily serine protease
VTDVVFIISTPTDLVLSHTVTGGIVSYVGRDCPEPNCTRHKGLIQVDAVAYRGSSGGALLSEEGKIIGIPILAASPGVTLCTPISHIEEALRRFRAQDDPNAVPE